MTDFRSKQLCRQNSNTTEKIDLCLENQEVVERKKCRIKNSPQLPKKQRTFLVFFAFLFFFLQLVGDGGLVGRLLQIQYRLVCTETIYGVVRKENTPPPPPPPLL